MNKSWENQLVTVTLYEKLGAAAGIRMLLDEILEKLSMNPTLKPRLLSCLEGHDRLTEIKQQVLMFISARSGGPDAGHGHSNTESLCALNISDTEYSEAVEDIVAAMKARGYDDATRSEILAILSYMKADIVPS